MTDDELLAAHREMKRLSAVMYAERAKRDRLSTEARAAAAAFNEAADAFERIRNEIANAADIGATHAPAEANVAE